VIARRRAAKHTRLQRRADAADCKGICIARGVARRYAANVVRRTDRCAEEPLMPATLVVSLMVVACVLCLAVFGMGLLAAGSKDAPPVDRHEQPASD
jgi:hypothetical protein